MIAAQAAMTARHRGFFTPNENDEVRLIFIAYRNYRIALFDTINNYWDFEHFEEPPQRQQAFHSGIWRRRDAK